MSTVQFDKDGYYFYKNYSSKASFHSENDRHYRLFNYVSKDISHLSVLLENYVSKGMDRTSFALTGYRYTTDDALEISGILLSAHEYYKVDQECIDTCFMTLVNAIGEYFNTLLINASLCEKNGRFERFDPIYEKDWYCERFDALTLPYLDSIRKDNQGHPRFRFFEKYKRLIGDDLPVDYESLLFIPYWKRNEKGFAYEIETQDLVKRMLFWMFDLSAPHLGSLSVSQREWLYGNIYGAWHKKCELVVPQRLFLSIPYLYRFAEDNDTFKQIDAQSLKAIYDAHVNKKPISNESKEDVHIASNCAMKLAKHVVHEEYEISDLRQLLFLEILRMIQKEQQIKKCKNCGLYFIVTNRNQLYCDRLTSDGKNKCNEIGRKSSFQRKKEDDSALKLYTKAYNTHRMRVRNEIPDWDADRLEAWRLKAKDMLEKVRSGELDIDAYAKWLKL